MREITFEEKLKTIVGQKINSISLLKNLKTGKIPKKELKNYTVLLYGEARSSLRIKIPERIKMCPLRLVSVRKFWCKMLKEESGGFLINKDHASLIVPTCISLGATNKELENAYLSACKKLKNYNQERFYEAFSLEDILKELTQMWIDEYILALESTNIANALIKYYGLNEDDVFYFRLHAIEDIKHSKAGLREILKIATDQKLQAYVIKRTNEALEKFPIWMT
ncbi:iron-containing redox enzyme family protein [Polaribacter porphyrae]|uniref:Thiaminase-2/PQQC domain-containing protein n=1 Tax=Polaribacter porphyrae TaxID=1137780 RepID=A0A2S7WSQ0_9FLAO|nr:iron-containing redox enzyme family protein [Polaribacter porphyrae]PQJ80625.1 hypothetical protein BTO18_16220 [Polaribacter porphyrae]